MEFELKTGWIEYLISGFFAGVLVSSILIFNFFKSLNYNLVASINELSIFIVIFMVAAIVFFMLGSKTQRKKE